MGGYPELRLALPRDYVHPSRTTRLLTPWVVSVTVGLLAVISIVGIGIAGSIFSSNGVHQAGVSATQAFLLLAVSLLPFGGLLADRLSACSRSFTRSSISSPL